MEQNTNAPKPADRARWLRRTLMIIALLIIIWLMAVATLIAVTHHMGTVDTAQRSDVIIVLGSGLRWDGSAGWALTRRTEHAARLWQQGYAPHLICTGGIAPDKWRSEADACREVAERAGVPRDAIYLEETSLSTEENAINAQQLMAAQDWQTAVVVSDSYHMLRAEYLFRRVGVEATFSPVSASLIRGRPTYMQSMLREVIAWHWQIPKDVLGLPFTRFPPF